MLIGIDGNEANVDRKVGISEYAYEILKEFYTCQRSNINCQFIIYLKNKPLMDMPKERDGWRYRVVGPSKFWTQFGLPLDLFFHRPRPHIFFSPTHYAPRFSPVPTAIAIMDLSFLYFPELFAKKDLYQLINWTKYSAQNASKIFTISNTTRDAIIKEYNVEAGNILVAYPGIKEISSKTQETVSMIDVQKKYKINGEYILFVGTLQPRKNIEKLIEAFAKLTVENLKLVIVGKKGWLYESILAAPRKFGVEERVLFLDFVSNEDLPVLYKNALCFVLPSLYEGFGLPVLEAMKYGCPVITSNVSSLPEAGGDAAIYIDPQSVVDISSKIESIVKNEKLRMEMIKKGYEHIKKFSWEETARKTLSVLQELGSKQ